MWIEMHSLNCGGGGEGGGNVVSLKNKSCCGFRRATVGSWGGLRENNTPPSLRDRCSEAMRNYILLQTSPVKHNGLMQKFNFWKNNNIGERHDQGPPEFQNFNCVRNIVVGRLTSCLKVFWGVMSSMKEIMLLVFETKILVSFFLSGIFKFHQILPYFCFPPRSSRAFSCVKYET